MKKNYLIVSNNRKIRDKFSEDENFDFEFADDLPKVLKSCMKHLEDGDRLAIDPLAGYLSRPNPFHTVVLKKESAVNCDAEENKESYLRDVAKLDTLLSRYWLHKEDYDFHNSCEEYREDHEYVDGSIAENSIMSIKAHINCF